MPIQPPALDDRSFDDLVSDLVARIPAHTPEWTNPRVGDPGRTLIDLFAWLGDTILYRANLVPERQRLVFLRLLGIPLRPALPARTVVSLSFKDENATAAQVIRPLATLDGPVAFETLSELTVLPVYGESYYKRIPVGDEAAELTGIVTDLQNLYQLDGDAVPYVTTPVFMSGATGSSSFDVSQDAADKCLWIALLAGTAEGVDDAKAALGETESGTNQLLSIGVVPAREVPDDYEAVTQRGHVPHIWEITTVDNAGNTESIGYVPLTTIADSTNGLTRAGTVRLELPARGIAGAPTNDVRQNYRAGVGDAPPRIDDPETASRLVAWVRLRPSPANAGDGEVRSIPLTWVGVNAVDVDAMQTVASRVIGQSDGAANQEFSLPARHVDASTLSLQLESSGHGYQTWLQIDDLALLSRDASGPVSAVYQLDREAGTVRFGDGIRGRIPEAGARVRVASMRSGGGTGGNIPAGTLTKIAATDLQGLPVNGLVVHQPLAASGGQAAETLAAAEQRIPALLRHGDRAVTAEDFQQLAVETPAISVGRVEILPHFKPQQRRLGVPGVVSVVVLPQKATLQAPNPRPDRPMLEAVHAHLDRRRPLATELYVIGCEYIGIGLSVGVEIEAGFGREDVLNGVRQTMRAYLWPLAPFGPAGAGWQLGQSVRDRELEIAVARVDGVRGLVDPGINLFLRVINTDTGRSQWRPVVRRQRFEPVEVTLRDWQLPELLTIDVRADEPPELNLNNLHGAGAGTNPFASASGIAVPVVPEMCS